MAIFDPNEPLSPPPVSDPDEVAADEANAALARDFVPPERICPRSADEEQDDEEGDWRTTDLARAGVDPLRSAGNLGRLTPEQLRVRRAFNGTARTEAERAADFNEKMDTLGDVGKVTLEGFEGQMATTNPADDEGLVHLERDHDFMTIGTDSVSIRPHLTDAQKYIDENGTSSTHEEIIGSIEAAGLSLETCRGAFPGTAGKPTKALKARRALVREVLLPMYEGGEDRALMAEVLQTSVTSLEGLVRRRRS
jgi:hypothetical protein